MSPKVDVRTIPQGELLCGWCEEYRDAAERAADLALDNDRLRKEVFELRSGEVHKALAGALQDERVRNRRLQAEASKALLEADEAKSTCPICGWQPERWRYRRDCSIRQALQVHAYRKHQGGS